MKNPRSFISAVAFTGVLTLSLLLPPKGRSAVPQLLEAAGLKGGLIVQVGLTDAASLAAWRISDAFWVQGLDRDRRRVERIRAELREQHRYGPVSADVFDGRHLPYIDHLVNLLVVQDAGSVAREEILRVLTPNGVAWLKQGDQWEKIVKPWPKGMDEWTHYLHDATGNAVAHDTLIGPPRHLQWIGGPRYSRHHDHMSAASAMVSARGRVFYIFDHGSHFSIQLPSRWQLVARDAFNGLVLWRRNISDWHPQLFRLKSGPAQLPRRLVAVGDHVYVTLGLQTPVSDLDAATGETLRTYGDTENTEEIIYSDGLLFLVINEKPTPPPLNPLGLKYAFQDGPRRVTAIEAASGKVLWSQSHPDILPLTLNADAQRVCFHDGTRILCVEPRTGRKLWQSEPLDRRRNIPTFFAPTLVLYQDLVFFSGGSEKPDERNRGGGDNTMYALDAKTGRTLWTAEHPPSGYKSPEDILILDGLVWTPETTIGSLPGRMIGRDPRTGNIVKDFLPDVETHWFHHRCYRAKATDRYLLTSRTGIEFVDPEKEHWECHHWVRGACLYGVMPANGLVYNPPHPCACYMESKLFGFNALAAETPTRRVPSEVSVAARLERGPAYDQSVPSQARPGDWPTLRGDEARRGFASEAVPVHVHPTWMTKLGGRLSSPVIAEGKVCVASIDEHTVHALDAATGKLLWSYTAGARVDSPPTLWQGRALFGCNDGYVYCLRAQDGALIWRFRAAPVDRRHGAFEQIESVWPVHGSVLIHDGVLWCVAGRSMFVDGGLRLIRLDPKTGRLLAETVMDEHDPQSGKNLQAFLKGLNMPVALPDVLSCDGRYIYMRSQRFDLEGHRQEIEIPTLSVTAQRGEGEHLFCPTGFLDDVWWHRSYWVYGRVFKSGAGGYYQAGRVTPAGRPLVVGDDTVFGYGRKPQYYRWTTPMEYVLFAMPKEPEVVPLRARTRAATRPAAQRAQARNTRKPAQSAARNTQRRRSTAKRPPATRPVAKWTAEVPILVRAMVLADRTLFIAGPPDLINEEETLRTFDKPETQALLARQEAALQGTEGALLRAVSSADGSTLAELKLKEAPVFDGLAAAHGRLYMSTMAGNVMCLSGGSSRR